MKKIIAAVFLGSLIWISSALAIDIEFHLGNGSTAYGHIKENGKMTIKNSAGFYLYGKVKENGRINLYSQSGEYWYGEIITSEGIVKIWSKHGDYLLGRIIQ